MKTGILLLAVTTIFFNCSFAQESKEKVMENRARELHRVISLNDQEKWKKYIADNYTQKLIDKPMQAKVVVTENDGSGETSRTSSSTADNISAKAGFFQVLHNDFGTGKIASIKMGQDVLTMVIDQKDMQGIFTFTFEKEKPYKIDALRIQVEQVSR